MVKVQPLAGTKLDHITITRPDDFHLHLRDRNAMASVVHQSALRFGRALIMPNLKPAVTTVEQAIAYRQRIIDTLAFAEIEDEEPETSYCDFPLMTLYLTDNTTPEEIVKAKESGYIHAVKYYPAGATTNSDAGVTDIAKVYGVLEMMQKVDLPLCVHGEVTDPDVDVFDREKVFVERHLWDLTKKFPQLPIVLEHVTTSDGVRFVKESGPNVVATITAHHLLLNRNAIFAGGIRPHHYCLPVLKREEHRIALLQAATSGNPKFFLGTDSAPHAKGAKENACGCAGCYTAPGAIELYAEAFDSVGKISKLEDFASRFGADFYSLPRNTGTLTLKRESQTIPNRYRFGDDYIVPFRAGETLEWRVVSEE